MSEALITRHCGLDTKVVELPSKKYTSGYWDYYYNDISNIQAFLIYRNRETKVAGLMVYSSDGNKIGNIEPITGSDFDYIKSVSFIDNNIIRLNCNSTSNGLPRIFALC